MRKLATHEIERLDPSTFKRMEKTPLVIVLDNIRSALNVGSVFRTADAFALRRVYLCGITAQPPSRDIMKTALGADQSVDWTYAEATTTVTDQLRQEGYQLFAVEQATDSIPLQSLSIDEGAPVAIILGNEVSGVDQEVIDGCDGVIEVPQFGTKHSLNVSVCTGVVVWEIFKKLRF